MRRPEAGRKVHALALEALAKARADHECYEKLRSAGVLTARQKRAFDERFDASMEDVFWLTKMAKRLLGHQP